jgi:hypothetical protein
MSEPLAGIAHQILNWVVVPLVKKIVESPPPDKYDLLIYVPESLATLDVPVPTDGSVRLALADVLGTPVDDKQVDEFLKMVWSHDDAEESSIHSSDADVDLDTITKPVAASDAASAPLRMPRRSQT